MRKCFLVLFCLLLSGCASYSGSGLKPGIASEADVLQTMGAPSLRWDLPDGGRQLAYPRGPAGFETFMVFIDGGGKLLRITEVLNTESFARIREGMTQAEVLQLIGPPQPQWTAYFKARDELVWEWRYCDYGGQLAFFDVLFDGTTQRVRTTMSRPDYRGPDGVVPPCAQVWGR